MNQTQTFQPAELLRDLWQRINVTSLLNRNLPSNIRISLSVGWGLAILPIAIFNQIFAPHAIWMVMVVVLSGLYSLGYVWIRNQAQRIMITRRRVAPVLIAGDRLREDFEIRNHSRLPLLWAELVDSSEIPGYQPGRVVSTGGDSSYRWQSDVECGRRGIFRIGPHTLLIADPFGLYRATLTYDYTDIVIIYPRVVEMPPLELPLGNASGANRRRRSLSGPYPAASVVDYRPGDSLRYIHWPTTAHRGRLTVKELEIEPSGDVWIVLDLNRRIHSGPDNEDGTFEFSIVMAASLAAELLTGADRRAVGLLTTSGRIANDRLTITEFGNSSTIQSSESHAIAVSPKTGSAQLWNILGTLASVEAADISLVQLLRGSRDLLGKRRTIFVISPDVAGRSLLNGHEGVDRRTSQASRNGGPVYETDDWVAELLHLKSGGLSSSVMLVEQSTDAVDVDVSDRDSDRVRSLLISQEIPTRIVRAGLGMRTVMTFRRTRQVVRSTPTGGAVTYEVEEEVG